MEITVNSQRRTITEKTTLSDLIKQMGLDVKRIVVEYNRNILSCDLFDATTLKSDDKIEIVNFVGGG